MSSKINQIKNLDSIIESDLEQKNIKTQEYFKNQNISSKFLTVFKSEWIETSDSSSNYSSDIKNELVPVDVYFTYNSLVEIPDYLVPFAKISLEFKSHPGTYLVGAIKTKKKSISEQWVTITADGDLIYSGPYAGLPKIISGGHYNGPYLFEESGQTAFKDVNNNDYPIFYKYYEDVYRIFYKYNDGNHNNQIFYGDIINITHQHDISDTGTVVNAYGDIRGGKLLAQWNATAAFPYSKYLDSMPKSTLHITSVSTTEIVADVRIDTLVGAFAPGWGFGAVLEYFRAYSSFSFSFSDPINIFLLKSGNLHNNGFVGFNFIFGGDPYFEVIKVEKSGQYAYLNENKQFLLQSFSTTGDSFLIEPYSATTSDNPEALPEDLQQNDFLYTTLVTHLNPAPFPVPVFEKQYNPIIGSNPLLYFYDEGYSATGLIIKDYTLRKNGGSKYFLGVDCGFLLLCPCTEVSSFEIDERIRTSTIYRGGHRYFIQGGPGGGPPNPSSYLQLAGTTADGTLGNRESYNSSVSTISKTVSLFTPSQQTCQFRIRVDIENPNFYNENKDYYNE